MLLEQLDKICIRNLEFRSVLGVDSWERAKEQPLLLSLTIYTDCRVAGRDDALQHSINYGTLCKLMVKYVHEHEGQFKSIEALAHALCAMVLQRYSDTVEGQVMGGVTVELMKPKALLHASGVGVLMTRLPSDLVWMHSPTIHVPTRRLEDVLFVRDLEMSVIVGVNPWERTTCQKIILSLDLFHFTPLGLSDKVQTTQDYRRITDRVMHHLDRSSYKTVEALATAIARICTVDCGVGMVRVSVRKPSALVFAEAACVEMTRTADDFVKSATNMGETGQANVSGEHVAYVALGSNIGNRGKNISEAVKLLCNGAECELVDSAFMYETEPEYVTDQPAFLNTVIQIQTSLSAIDLLRRLKVVEKEIGRQTTFRYGPREIDLDLLLYDNLVLKTGDELDLPHPRLQERAFVLVPLCDIAPTLKHPTLQHSFKTLMEMLDHSTIQAVKQVTPLANGSTLSWSNEAVPKLMGILNTTPDSFSDGNETYVSPPSTLPEPKELPQDPLSHAWFSYKSIAHHDLMKIQDRIRVMVEEGCDMIDIGGQSTRPNAEEFYLWFVSFKIIGMSCWCRSQGSEWSFQWILLIHKLHIGVSRLERV